MEANADRPVHVVAIAKGEDRFIEEWLVYHRMLGADRFFVYDNDPALPLRSLLAAHADYATVIDWPGDPTAGWPGRNRQARTYTEALARRVAPDAWVAFLDPDEFIVLREHDTLQAFLSSLGNVGSVRLNWHVFGHNGHYEDPEGLVTAALTRRMAAPSPQTKAISRVEAVSAIDSAHFCRLKPGWRTVDGNGRPYSGTPYPGRTARAHVNHYQCRSFLTWMDRVRRGDVSFDRSNVPAEHRWRLDEHLCLRQFVETVARDKNEVVDDYMLRFEFPLLSRLGTRPRRGFAESAVRRSEPADFSSIVRGSPAIPARRKRWFTAIAAKLASWSYRFNGWRLRRRLERRHASE